MAYGSDVQRITRALNWIGSSALGLGIAIVVWALWWTRGVDDFRTAVIVAALGFGLPSLVALTLAWLLDPLTEPEPPGAAKGAVSGTALPTRRAALGWPAVAQYIAAVIAVGVAAVLRDWLQPILGEMAPFATFYLAIVVAGWIGGFGPSALATALSLAIVSRPLWPGGGDLPSYQLGNVAALGVFAAVALAIGGITATMRATAAAADRMSAETKARNAELQSAESELRHERDRIRVTLESIGDAVITTAVDGVVTFLNPAAERLTGWRSHDARGVLLEKVMELVDEKSGAQLAPLLDTNAQARTPYTTHHAVLIDRKGTSHIIDESGAPIIDDQGAHIGHVVVFRDTTDARRTQAALLESEARFRTTADTAPVLIWMANKTKGCDYVNRQWLEFTGRALEQELGDGWADGVHPEDLDRCLAIYAGAFDARRQFQLEYRLRRFDGEYRWVFDSGVPRFGPGGEFVGYIGACIDVTDQKKARHLVAESAR
jgi:PAS domain S-box-containing protein